MNSPYGHPGLQNCPISQAADPALNRRSFSQPLQNSTAHELRYPAGTVIFLEGDLPRGVFVLRQGRAKLTVTNASGRRLISRIAFPGDILGLHSVITGDAYDAAAETIRPSRVQFIPRADFLHFLQEHGDAGLHMVQHLSRDYGAAYSLVRSIALSRSAAQRLARLLLDWCGQRAATRQVSLELTHEDMAQLIGASRETVTRLLGEFRRRRILDVKRSYVEIRNRSRLEKLLAR